MREERGGRGEGRERGGGAGGSHSWDRDDPEQQLGALTGEEESDRSSFTTCCSISDGGGRPVSAESSSLSLRGREGREHAQQRRKLCTYPQNAANCGHRAE